MRPAAVPRDPATESGVGGWGIRREGNGRQKPTHFSDRAPAANSSKHRQMVEESMLPRGEQRFNLAPQTDGYPDVDTYRDLEFYLVRETPIRESTYRKALKVTKVNAPPTGSTVRIAQTKRDETGPTSFRFCAPRRGRPTKTNTLAYDPDPTRDDQAIREQSEAHYYYRDRDLGQTFVTGKSGFRLGAITVRLQPVDVARADPSGAKISVQLMKVTGKPRINDNNTTQGNPRWATYAFTWPDDESDASMPDRRPFKYLSDDFIEGEKYEHLMLASGGVVPDNLQTNDYLRFEFSDKGQYLLEPNTRYAFLFLFDEPAPPGVKRNIPLSNINVLPGGRGKDSFPEGHMIRREGSSTEFDKVFIANLKDELDVRASRDAASFPTELGKRLMIQPGTLGYPDVDTYRDMYFLLESAK